MEKKSATSLPLKHKIATSWVFLDRKHKSHMKKGTSTKSAEHNISLETRNGRVHHQAQKILSQIPKAPKGGHISQYFLSTRLLVAWYNVINIVSI